MSDKRTLTRSQWVRRSLATLGIFLLAVNSTAGWARFVMGDEMHEPWFLGLARWPLAAMFFWWAVVRLIEDLDITVRDRRKEDAP